MSVLPASVELTTTSAAQHQDLVPAHHIIGDQQTLVY